MSEERVFEGYSPFGPHAVDMDGSIYFMPYLRDGRSVGFSLV